MREHLFKAKRTDNKEWVIGSLINNEYILNYIDLVQSWEPLTSDHKITCRAYEINPHTISQYIGIKDKAGNRIFENNILRGSFGTGLGLKSTKYKEFNFKVTYHGHSPEFHLEMPKDYGRYRFCPHLTECLIIGNTFDHSELLQ